MFSKSEKRKDTVDTVIGKGTVLEGKIQTEASMRVDGNIKGEVICQGDLTVGKDGCVDASVQGRNVIIAGEIKGNVQAKEKIHIESSGTLIGNVEMNTFIIDEGGTFKGESKMKSEQPKPSVKQKEKKTS
ncbi:MAG: polymer-forming cytoskeletal protein [Bacillaceae bacterium]|nr:polymer-forming cytoskeletal protein [Bacillaceae bacterium]